MTHHRRSQVVPTTPTQGVTPPGHPMAAPALANSGVGSGFGRGTVMEVDARRHSYRVAMNDGATIAMTRLRSTRGDNALLEVSDPVLVCFALGVPYIVGVMPLEVEHSDDGPSLMGQAGQGGEDPAFDRHLPVTGRDPRAPTDLLPGDRSLSGPDGATVAALRGPVALLSGGPMARVTAHGDSDHVSVAAGTFREDTWMGYREVRNDAGKTSLVWRGGSDQLTQTGADEGRFTIALDVGHTGDLLRFELTNREGQALFRLHVDPQGRAELFAAGGFSQMNGSGPDSVHETAHHGSAVHEVTGNHTHRARGKTTVSGDQGVAIKSASAVEVVAGGEVSIVGVAKARVLSGADLLLVATDKLRLNGAGVIIEPGIEDVLINATVPRSVKIGSAEASAVRYEQLASQLQTLMSEFNALRASYATHFHTVTPAVGPVPAMAVLNPVLASFARPVILDLLSFRSRLLLLS